MTTNVNVYALGKTLKDWQAKEIKLDVEKIRALEKYIKNLDTNNATIAEIENCCDKLNKKY